MRDPWPEHIRRLLDACAGQPAHQVLTSAGWADLRRHCGDLAIALDSLGRRTIAQRVDRDYARLHEQLREATNPESTAASLLCADAVAELASTLASIQRFQAVAGAPRASGPAGIAAASQNPGSEPKRAPEARRPPPTLTVAAFIEWTNFSHSTLNKYARLAKVPTPRRGERNFRYTWADARKILETIIAQASDRRIRDKCRTALKNPPEITQ
ncbi:MAG TPA: hypothetical protein P5572_00635 [Phycisphaerae bacterium]|nr:hypothetical protein [Phycisphaerae bacterium]